MKHNSIHLGKDGGFKETFYVFFLKNEALRSISTFVKITFYEIRQSIIKKLVTFNKEWTTKTSEINIGSRISYKDKIKRKLLE